MAINKSITAPCENVSPSFYELGNKPFSIGASIFITMMFRTKFNDFYHYCYLTTNLTDPIKRYVGDHTTKSLNDGYLGSGVELTVDIKKLGRNNFSKIILDFYPTRLEASKAQEHFIRQYKTHWSQGGYNLTWTGILYINGHHSPEICRKIKEGNLNRTPEQKQQTSQKLRDAANNRTPEQKQRHKKACESPEFKQKQHLASNRRTAEQKQRHKEAMNRTETKQKLRDAVLNYTPEQKQNALNATKAPERCQKISNSLYKKPIKICTYCGFKSKNAGIMTRYHFNNCNKNPNHILKEEPIYICPYCGLQSKNKSNMTRWHFDNCKEKNKDNK